MDVPCGITERLQLLETVVDLSRTDDCYWPRLSENAEEDDAKDRASAAIGMGRVLTVAPYPGQRLEALLSGRLVA
jgi:hypothetical protein